MPNRTRQCHACIMLAQGVKFRKAPKHTCEKGQPQKIRIPKVDPTKVYDIVIQRGQIVETEKAMRVRLQKQVIAGLTIPEGFEAWLPGEGVSLINGQSSSRPIVTIKGWKVNEILRTVYLDKLRNG